jgi:hypothetical protein
MSGRIVVGLIDFTPILFSYGVIRCRLQASFLVRNWIGICSLNGTTIIRLSRSKHSCWSMPDAYVSNGASARNLSRTFAVIREILLS